MWQIVDNSFAADGWRECEFATFQQNGNRSHDDFLSATCYPSGVSIQVGSFVCVRGSPVETELQSMPLLNCTLFLSQAPWSTLAAVGRGASGEKDMSEVRTTDKLYNAKVKRAGSGHELGEVEAVVAGCSWHGLSSGAIKVPGCHALGLPATLASLSHPE